MGEEGSGASRGRRKRYEAPVIWLWFAGRDLDEENGKGRTNARWLEDATRVFHPTGHAGKWSRMRHWKRSAIRQSLVLGAVLVGWDWYFHPAVTILGLSCLAAIYGGHHVHRGTRKFFPLRHYWQYVRPFSLTLRAELGIVPLYLKVAPDRSKVIVGLPHEYLGSDHERAAITKAVTEKLAIEAPDATWRLSGRSHEVEYNQEHPPPLPPLTWDGVIAAAVGRMKPDELITGIGHGAQVITASLESDSPHLGIGMGTGGGKSNLVAFWLIQRLILGDFALIVDGKRFSHPWAFKDMNAEYGLLPNIGYVRRVSDIHDALVWLGKELHDRNERAEQVINAKGILLGHVGNRLFVVLEELNLIVPMLKLYWQKIRGPEDPKHSPALLALSAVSYAGRAVGIHLVFMGQRLDADVFGCSGSQGGAVRGQVGVRALARYDERAWKLQAGGAVMPPSPSVPGRVQLWIAGTVYETQVPLMDFEQARKLAVSGAVTLCPPDMPGIEDGSRTPAPPVSVRGHVMSDVAPDQRESVGSPPDPDKVTLPEAHRDGVFGDQKLETIQRYSRRDGFPASTGEWRGNAKVYLLSDLYAYQSKKERISA